VNQESFRNILHLSRNWAAPDSTGVISVLDRMKAIATVPPSTSAQGEIADGLLSGTALVLKGWANRSHWVRIAWRAPAHCPGPVRRYWYGVQGPKKILTQSTGSVSSSVRRFGRTPTCDWKYIMRFVSYRCNTNDNAILYPDKLNQPPLPWNPGKGCILPGELPFVGKDSWESKSIGSNFKKRFTLYVQEEHLPVLLNELHCEDDVYLFMFLFLSDSMTSSIFSLGGRELEPWR